MSFLKADGKHTLELKLQGKEGVTEHTNKPFADEQTERKNNGAKGPVTDGLEGRKRPAGQVRSALLS